MMLLGNLKGDDRGNIRICPGDVLKTMEHIRDTTSNPDVKHVMENAIEAYSKQPPEVQAYHPGIVAAASVLLHEMAAIQRAQRVVLWLGPALTLVACGLLFMVLKTFLRLL